VNSDLLGLGDVVLGEGEALAAITGLLGATNGLRGAVRGDIAGPEVLGDASGGPEALGDVSGPALPAFLIELIECMGSDPSEGTGETLWA